MISKTGEAIVALFFIHGALASFIIGGKLWYRKDASLKFFGLAFSSSGLAFTTWTIILLAKLNNAKVMAALAAVFLIVSLLLFFLAGVQHLDDSDSYDAALFIGSAGAVALFVLRTFIYPAHIIITSQGYLLFDLRTAVKVAYILAISVSLLPAAGAVAGKLKKTSIGPLIKGATTALAIGAIILVISEDTNLVLVDGIGMSVAFLILWVGLLTAKNIPNKEVLTS